MAPPVALQPSELAVCLVLLILNLLVLALIAVELVRSILSKRRRMSYHFVFLCIASGWIFTRVALFATLVVVGRPRVPLFWILLYGSGPNFIFATFSLLALFYADFTRGLAMASAGTPAAGALETSPYTSFVDGDAPSSPKQASWSRYRDAMAWIGVNTAFFCAFLVWAAIQASGTSRPVRSSGVKMIFSTVVFGVLVLVLFAYSFRFTRLVQDASTSPSLRMLSASPRALVRLVYLLMATFSSRVAYDVYIAVTRDQGVYLDAHMSVGQAVFLLVSMVVWEVLPIGLCVLLFRTRQLGSVEAARAAVSSMVPAARQPRYFVNDDGMPGQRPDPLGAASASGGGLAARKALLQSPAFVYGGSSPFGV